MKLKKISAIILTACFAVSAVACADNSVQNSEEVSNFTQESETSESETSEMSEGKKEIVFPLEETAEFTMFNVMQNGDFKLSEAESWIVACERANIFFEQTEVPAAEGSEKFNLLVASDDYPEVVFKGAIAQDDINDLGMEGVLIPLEDLIREYAPNLTALLDERDAWQDITAPDGHVYTFPQVSKPMTTTGWQIWYNQTWRENLGIAEPTNMDEFYNMLKAFADEDADGDGDPNNEIPLEFNTVTTWRAFLQYFTDGIHYINEHLVLVDDELFFYPMTDAFKDNFLTLMINMYNDGILDPLSFTQTYDQVRAIGMTKVTYGAIINAAPASQTVKEGASQYQVLKPFEKGYLPINRGVTPAATAITDKCENPEIFVAFMDYFYTQEGGALADLGVEGTHYKVNEDGTYKELIPYSELSMASYNINGTATTALLLPDIRYRYEGDTQTAERFSVPSEYGVFITTLVNTEDEGKRITDLAVAIDEYVATYVAQVTIGEMSLEDSWDEFQETLKEMGAEELLELYQEGYDRAIAE